MLRKRVRDELSAYADGESRRPQDMERLIRENPEAARYLEEYRRCSDILHKLDAPDSSEAFITRVMAHAADETPARRKRLHWAWVAVPVATAALLLFTTLTFIEQQSSSQPNDQFAWTQLDPDDLIDLIAARLETGEELDTDDLLEFAPVEAIDADDPDAWTTEMLLAADTAFTSFSPEDELYSRMAVLDEEESAELKQLVLEYAGKG